MNDEIKEKMNELMNKISFALKDATLAQGFEIICKRISELEKENEQLRVTVDTTSKHILKLQADKGKLTDTVRKLRCCSNCKHKHDCSQVVDFIYPDMLPPVYYGCRDLDKWERGL